MRKYLYIIVLVLLCTGCNRKKVEMDLDMYNSNQISLMVKGKKKCRRLLPRHHDNGE